MKLNSIYVFDDINDNMVLRRENNKKRCHAFPFFGLFQYYSSHQKELFQQRYHYMISVFEEKISQEAPHINLDFYHKNLKTLKVSDFNFWLYNKFSSKDTMGSYSLLNNEILIEWKGSLRIFAHELFHMLGRSISATEYKSGFHYINIKDIIHVGKYFNEGYVEVLSDRYFGLRSTPAYAKEKVFASLIEDVVGKEKMEELYSKADIEGLFQEIMPYTTEDRMVRFFQDVERNHKLRGDSKGNLTRQQLMTFARCQNFCLECRLEKWKQEGLSDQEIGHKYFEFLGNVYNQTASAYPNSLYIETLNRVAKISYENVIGERKSNIKL